MKIVLLASIFTLVSCAHMEHDITYYADTAGTYKCDPMVLSKAWSDLDMYNDSFFDSYEKQSGYSECTYKERSAQTVSYACNKPIKYEFIASKTQAPCHKFLADNKVQVTR